MNKKVVFLLFKPDVFLRGLLPSFIDLLEKDQFIFYDFFCGLLNKTQFDAIYSCAFRWDVDDWYHNQELYEFGPALGLALGHNSRMDALKKLQKLKGSALPKNRPPDSLRRILNSRSRVFNLLHVPDNQEESNQSLFSWFRHTIEFQNKEGLSSESVINEIDTHQYFSTSEIDPERTFLISKIRLFHAFQKTQKIPNSLYQLLEKLKIFYLGWLSDLKRNINSCQIEGTIIHSMYDKERALFDPILNSSPNNQMVQAVKLLADLKNVLSSNFFWLLESWNVYLSSLEQYLLKCRFKYS